jgi:hypothetical protein
MRNFTKRMGKALPALLAAMAMSPAAFALDFSSNSPLATGTWAKLGVTENGVYEISYDRLRELGFSNPEKVGVWGEGAPMYPINFLSTDNSRQIPETLQKVAVWHHNGKLYFYATGPESLSFTSDSSVALGARFNNNGLNLYTDYGCYFLSDTEDPAQLRESDKAPEDNGYIDQGYSYFYHEIDTTQGSSHSGKDFWGENFLALGSDRTVAIPYTTPGLVEGSTAAMTMRCMGQSEAFDFTCTLDDDTSFAVAIPDCSGSIYFNENVKKYYDVSPKHKSGNFTVSMPVLGSKSCYQAYMDYFLLSYKRDISFDTDESQFNVTTQVAAVGMVQFPEGSDVVGWDVTSATNPIHLNAEANRLCTLDRGNRNLVFFKSDKEQKQPAYITPVASQDIHGIAQSSNPTMIIITTSELKNKAQELADFHKLYDNVDVLVFTAEQVYNEFSQGHPDPMAYRNMCKMFYEKSGSKLNSVLLYGPSFSNVRYTEDKDASNALIVLQGDPNKRDTELYSFTDLYGILSDQINTNSLPSQKMQISVAILPVQSEAEATVINDKIQQYYLDDSKAYWLDKIIYTCDDADSELHLGQSELLSSSLTSNTSSAMYPFKLYIGEYGRNLFVPKLLEEYKRGAIVNTYIGHGSAWSMSTYELLHGYDIPRFDNDRLGFMNFAGCSSTNFETGLRGIPELLNFNTTKGLVGAQVSTRSSWSNENKMYMTSWQHCLVAAYDDNGRALTLGEVTKNAKNIHTGNTGKYKFVLMADPLLRLPVPTMGITLNGMPDDITVGETVSISGTITNPVASLNSNNFNGTVLVKWFEANHTEQAANQMTGYVHTTTTSTTTSEGTVTETHETPTYITYSENILATEAYQVTNGKFNIDLTCPSVMVSEAGKSVKVSFVAYDSENDNAAAVTDYTNIIAAADGETTADTQAPVIESMEVPLQANGAALADCTLLATVTDNEGLRIDAYSPDAPLSLMLDDQYTIDNFSECLRLSEGSKQLNISVPLKDLSYGYHKLTLSVSDYAPPANTPSKWITTTPCRHWYSPRQHVAIKPPCRYQTMPQSPPVMPKSSSATHMATSSAPTPCRTTTNGTCSTTTATA